MSPETLNYTEAFKKLEQLVAEIEDESLPLHLLPQKIQEANTYIRICEEKLRAIGEELTDELQQNAP